MCRILRHVLEQLVRSLEESAIDEVVALDARERGGEFRVAEVFDVVRVQLHVRERAFPDRPGARGFAAASRGRRW